ncbi:hypothetical protein H072_7805 [Dactylellina haptotyla CBS 200.50]|uniref:Uncharacterized protein n=1 Tax=Dactylellina haptotyla (strain CBS 200.50) TaxID=1284197 RepID=S8ABG7_DACHA|nr:hypothetical protein H072_7805 [Dactylellina haptotyla CBS 200.50]
MVQFSKISTLGFVPLAIILKFPFASGVIINVIVGDTAEIWRENDENSFRRKDPEPLAYRLCRPPSDKPWLGVFVINPQKMSCADVEGSSHNWDIVASEWEPPEFFPKAPGSLLQIQGPTGVPIMNTEFADEFLTYGSRGGGGGLHASTPSKWLVERFGNTQNYEVLTYRNPLQVGDTLRFWEPGVVGGFGQLFLHRIAGSPMRLNRMRPTVDEDSPDDFATAIRKIRSEYPYAELRIASLGDDEIVGPGMPSRKDKIYAKLETVKNAFSGLFRGGHTQSQPIGLELGEGFEVLGHNPEGGSHLIGQTEDAGRVNIGREAVTSDDVKVVSPKIPARVENKAGQEIHEESKESNDRPRNAGDLVSQIVTDEVRSRSKSSNSGNSGSYNRDGQSIKDSQTQYETAWGETQFQNEYDDEDDGDRLGDIID